MKRGTFHGGLHRVSGRVSSACLALLLAGLSMGGHGQVVQTRAPAEAGESDKYRVFIRAGTAPEREIQVLLSRANGEGDYRASELEGRTFSYAAVSYGPACGPLQIRVVKTFGEIAQDVTIHPLHGAPAMEKSPDGRGCRFAVESPGRYLSVHFEGEDNQTPRSKWIRHMLAVFIDPLETEMPGPESGGVVNYRRDLDPQTLRGARTIAFPPGFHDLKKFVGGDPIDRDGVLHLGENQALYLAGGSFVEGLVETTSRTAKGQRIYGRGVLSGRAYLWRRHPRFSGRAFHQLVLLGDQARIDGVTLQESPNHGIVAQKTEIRNLKFLGWHCNNDAIRVGSGSSIRNSFLRAVDDFFYNFNIHVSNVVLWPGHNGAVLTYGWGEGNTYRSGASLLEDLDLIHPEWTALGNNNGLIASQVKFDYRPYGYGGNPLTRLRHIRIEGSIPGLVNLKPYTGAGGAVLAKPEPDGKVGSLGEIILQDVSVAAMSGKSLIQGAGGASPSGETFWVQKVRFENLRIGGVRVTRSNQGSFFSIDPATTREIEFPEEAPWPPTRTPY